MLRLRIVCIGKTRSKPFLAAEREYSERIKSLASLLIEEFEPSRDICKLPELTRKSAETDFLLSKVRKGEFLIGLDEKGKSQDSVTFARSLEKLSVHGRSQICFAVAGAFGWDRELLEKRADLVVSMSNMTFPHELARLVLVEQLYRALSIIHHLPYHK